MYHMTVASITTPHQYANLDTPRQWDKQKQIPLTSMEHNQVSLSYPLIAINLDFIF